MKQETNMWIKCKFTRKNQRKNLKLKNTISESRKETKNIKDFNCKLNKQKKKPSISKQKVLN